MVLSYPDSRWFGVLRRCIIGVGEVLISSLGALQCDLCLGTFLAAEKSRVYERMYDSYKIARHIRTRSHQNNSNKWLQDQGSNDLDRRMKL